MPWRLLLGLAALAAVVVGVAIVNTLNGSGGQSIAYDAGRPGPGDPAPDFTIAAADGSTFRLADERGKQVLLYFHEGLGCDPCWRQLDNIQADFAQFRALGIDQVAAISVDPASAQGQRARRTGITLPVVPDVDLAVSRAYNTLGFGMMGGTVPGHTFILVGADGTIRWRADYGGPPNFTMFVPDTELLRQLGKAIAAS